MIGIYKIINLVNGKLYIGSAINIKARWINHKSKLLLKKHHSIKLQRSWNKYGEENFKFEIIEECDKYKLIEREQHYIDLYNSYNNGYNCSPKSYSCLGIKRSNETKIKMSQSQIGNKNNLGKKRSQKTKDTLSKSLTGNTNRKGRKHSNKTIQLLREQRIGRNSSSYNSTPILQYDLQNNFIKEWRDLISLKDSGFHSGHISECCRGKLKRYSGFIWKFKTL